MNTKKMLLNSFKDLINEYTFEEITVDMILNRAEVSRSTFYRHYRDKYDLMSSYYKTYVDELMNKYDFSHYRDFIYDTFMFVKENYSYFKKVVKISGDNSFDQFIYDYGYEYYKGIYLLHGSQALTDKERIQLTVLAAGGAKMLVQWVKSGCREDPADLAEWMTEMLPHGLRELNIK